METKKLTDNELIAEFMGWTIDNSFPDKDTVYRLGNKLELKTTFKFYTSWDWLMPVVEKIKQLYNNSDDPFKAEWLSQNIFNLSIMTPIEKAYSEVVEFIKWYSINGTK